MKNKIWLDQLRAEDRDTVFSLTSDPEIVKYMRFGTHKVPEEAEELIRNYTEKGNYGFLIRLTDSGEPIGVAAMKHDEEKTAWSIRFRCSVFRDSGIKGTIPSQWNY